MPVDPRAAPTWDSHKKELWSDWASDFESFAALADAEELVEMHHSIVHPCSEDREATTELSSSHESGAKAEETSAPKVGHDGLTHLTPQERFASLSSELKQLDTKLYHVMKLKVTGPAHEVINHAPTSFVQTMVLLFSEFGTSNMLRKTALIKKRGTALRPPFSPGCFRLHAWSFMNPGRYCSKS